MSERVPEAAHLELTVDLMMEKRDLVAALKGLMSLVNEHEGHGTPSFSNSRVDIYLAMNAARLAIARAEG